MIVKANSLATWRWTLCVGAFGALFSACMPDGTSPELPITQAGAGGASGAAAGSGAAGSSAGSAAGRGVSSGAAGMAAMAGKSGGAAGSSTSPAMGRSGAGGASMGMAGRSGTAGSMGAAGSMGMAGRMATAGMSAGGMGGAMAMAGRGGMGGMGGMAMGGMGGAAAGGMSGAAGGGATSATFTEVYGLIMAGCSCHVSGSPGNLSMSNKMTAYMNLVGANSQACGGQKRVAAGDPNNSVLFHSIDRSMLGSCMVPAMPAGGMAKWPQANIDKVKAWIMAGAMNN